ncbi:TPA: hypothetical protein H1012_01115, partial [archaeon]|nr:hypothetical protein [Candidatus Naiadarchaeales archaeon SRR2090159.bin1288]
MATSEDEGNYKNFVRILMLKNAEFIKKGKTEQLENLAIFHFIARHFVLAKMYGSDHLKSVVRMLEMYRTVVKKRGGKEDEKISILAAHQKMLLRMRDDILRRIDKGEWDDRKTP